MPARAQSFENLERLDSLVAMTMGANRGEPGGPIAPVDRRLRLAACPTTPNVEGPQMSAAIVSCPAVGWRIRVPLAPIGQAPQAATAQNSAASPALPVIKKGDPVRLIAGNEVFSVSRPMIADEDGVVGALIRVRQDARATPVTARVEAMGVVRAPAI
ncbi:MAG TPA: flagella basal body P-ring formation protein FlgA [Sphingobium sp.]|nr:flagella basal body P-ring formation protein FlgA [Sphingobium sp.]